MHSYRVTCSYDEVLRFKKSAAVAAVSDPCNQGISDARKEWIQVVADIFYADIKMASCPPIHLVWLLRKLDAEMTLHTKDDIKRLRQEELNQAIDDGQDEFIMQYNGHKNP